MLLGQKSLSTDESDSQKTYFQEIDEEKENWWFNWLELFFLLF